MRETRHANNLPGAVYTHAYCVHIAISLRQKHTTKTAAKRSKGRGARVLTFSGFCFIRLMALTRSRMINWVPPMGCKKSTRVYIYTRTRISFSSPDPLVAAQKTTRSSCYTAAKPILTTNHVWQTAIVMVGLPIQVPHRIHFPLSIYPYHFGLFPSYAVCTNRKTYLL